MNVISLSLLLSLLGGRTPPENMAVLSIVQQSTSSTLGFSNSYLLRKFVCFFNKKKFG
jgi:hypothetical protein